MLILCSCCSRAHLPCPCYCAHVDLPCPCSRDHVDSMLIFRTRIPMPMFPCPCLSHARVYPIPMFIPSPCRMCLPHDCACHVLMFNSVQIVSCINIKIPMIRLILT